ncbi:hypothetical protein AU48_03705 [Salmonella enterica subsp. enterica serovar Enteritidis str. EC20120008]|uniref:Uncharacterized protein n=3 Tax=Salmonella enterica I TaxID=59201 RepID=A0A6C6Z4C0_SALPB|nr:hypothetical protein SPAB_02854 [Salmonella enterica subsp. enterica serovar Paratyphi B str. SPB7]AHO49780.1 hypothetical protein AU24_03710 [Salmonella enterica subsp. enterica serovar Enteritidis str. EC20110361]AHO54104.1 hypothetical protein AU23_03695 [Salmonella enterica subsp. enterica serovar Enteritidis str. EC20110360]AHO58431.1 hypothetical protein AU21_03700 [Salmonella enterica subsp. enterica serovar Enteritidis str. EC20110359]AHO62800.1 hypothetical protein AU20_03675 [Salmo
MSPVDLTLITFRLIIIYQINNFQRIINSPRKKENRLRAYPTRRYWRSQFGHGQRAKTGAYT